MTYWQRWKRTALHNQALVLVGITGFIITAVNVGVVCIQAWLSQHNAAESSKQTDRIIANSNSISKALQASVAQSKEALEASITASRDDQRAWILPSKAEILSPLEAGKDFSVRIFVSNTGKTPATIRLSTYFAVTAAMTEEGLMDESPFVDESTYVVAPSGFIDAIPQFNKPLPENVVLNIQAGNRRIFLLVRIVYDDVFGRHHKTRFCYYLTGAETTDRRMSLYEKGNSAD